MAASDKKEYGEMPCPNDDCESHNAARPVIVFENSKGTLSYTCDKCRSSQYAKVGDLVREHWIKRIGKGKAAAPAAELPATATQPAPAKKPESATTFG